MKKLWIMIVMLLTTSVSAAVSHEKTTSGLKSSIATISLAFAGHPGPSSIVSIKNNSSNRMIGYIAGWAQPPVVADLVNAGYTHVIITFGVFSTKVPGVIISAFNMIDQQYIRSLQATGIKVLLALGGPTTNLPDTTTNFDQALASVNPDVFTETFISSMEMLLTQYGFDGFDFDIESGLLSSGSFTYPTGDIAILANIIKTIRHKYPDILLSLAPQVENISATQGFDSRWGNYASLVMQTAPELSWVGIQLYNSGCCFGIDTVCYGLDDPSSPAMYVAMVTDLLENWPAKDKTGRDTGFQPYISYLDPSQVVLGFPAAAINTNNESVPPAMVATIKRAIQCLRTGDASCVGYKPPRTYATIGGVFERELSFDSVNSYQFAKSLRACVMQKNCE